MKRQYLDNVIHGVDKKSKKEVPIIESKLKKHIVTVPQEIYAASGIQIFGKRIKSLLFTTDLAIVKNNNADGIIAVYPFTPQVAINNSIIDISTSPVFVGVGGGLTTGQRSLDIAMDAELHGAFAVVLNAPTTNAVIMEMKKRLDIPIVITIISENEDFDARIEAGAAIFNVSGANKTSSIVRKIREKHPQFPIIATGGPSPESISETIEAGANVITYTPPTSAELFSLSMERYRKNF